MRPSRPRTTRRIRTSDELEEEASLRLPRSHSVGAPSRPAEPAQQRSAGLLGGLLGRGSVAPPAQSPYPTLRQSFGRGFLAVCSSPVVLGITLVVPFLVWAVLQLLGSVPLIGNLAGYLSLPSIGVSSDIVAANQTFGVRGGSLAAPVLIAIRAVLTAVLAGLVVEQIRYGRVTGRGLRAGLRAIPVTLAIGILAFSATLIINIVGGFGLGIAVSLLLLVGSVFFLAYGPIVGVEHPRGIGLALRRTFAAARVPGSRTSSWRSGTRSSRSSRPCSCPDSAGSTPIRVSRPGSASSRSTSCTSGSWVSTPTDTSTRSPSWPNPTSTGAAPAPEPRRGRGRARSRC